MCKYINKYFIKYNWMIALIGGRLDNGSSLTYTQCPLFRPCTFPFGFIVLCMLMVMSLYPNSCAVGLSYFLHLAH